MNKDTRLYIIFMMVLVTGMALFSFNVNAVLDAEEYSLLNKSVSIYHFDEATGVTAVDHSNAHINNNSCTLTNGAKFNTSIYKFGGSSYFGSDNDDYCDMISSDYQNGTTPTGFALSLWAYPTAVDIGVEQNLYYGRMGDLLLYLLLRTSGDSDAQFLTTQWVFRDTAHTLNANTWNHIVLTCDGSKCYFFADGSMVYSVSTSLGSVATVDHCLAGQCGGNGFRGNLDEYIVFNENLTLDEVNWLYTSGEALDGVGSGTPPESPINVNITNPLNGTYYGIGQMYSNNSLVSIEYDTDTRGAVCTINDSRFTEYLENNTDITLKGYYPFTTNISEDYSGNGNDGVVVGATWEEISLSGGGFSFDGIDDYIDLGDTPDLETDLITVSLWVNPKENDQTYAGFGRSGFFAHGWKIYESGSNYYGLVYTTTGSINLNTGIGIDEDTWTYLTLTYNGTHAKLYKNGILAKTGTRALGQITYSGGYHTCIGSMYCGGVPNAFGNVSIDEFKIYNRSLSESEIIEVYQETITSGKFRNNTVLTSGDYDIKIDCNKTGTTNGTAEVEFFVDHISPNIFPSYNLYYNLTYILDNTLTTNINFSDDHEIYSLNVTFANGTILFNETDMGRTNYHLNISYGVDTTAVNNIDVRLCDSHTNQEIKDIKHKTEDKGIKYIMKEKFFIDTEWVKVYPKTPIRGVNPDTTKLEDRYIFDLPRSPVYVVESSHPIDITKNQKFDGHLVIPGIGDNGYWLDFTNEEANNYIVRRVNDYKVEVVIAGIMSDRPRFTSIGELNCIETSFYFVNLNPQTQYSFNTIANNETNFNLSITRSDDFITSLNATLYYNNTVYNAGTEDNFTKTITMPSFFGLHTNKSFNWVLNVNGVDNNLTAQQQTIHNVFLDNCSNSSFYKTAQINFLNIDDGTPRLVNATLDIAGYVNYYDIHSDITNISLCIYPEFAVLPVDFDIAFSTNGPNQYYINNFTFTNTTTNINLYVESGEEATTFTIYDKSNGEVLPNVFVSMFRRINGDYNMVASTYTDITGRTQLLYQEDIEYKFLLTKDGYQPYLFYLNPIIYDDYDIYLERDVSWNISQDFDKVAIYYYPTTFYNNRENNFTFMIHSPYSELNSYGYTLTYPGGSKSASGNGQTGQELNSLFNISGATENNRVKLDYYYNTDISGYRNFTKYYSVIVGNNTMIANKDRTYGLGIFERVLIAVIIAIFFTGIATLIGKPLIGFGMGLAILGYLTAIGFIPVWVVLLPITIGLIILGSRGEY